MRKPILTDEIQQSMDVVIDELRKLYPSVDFAVIAHKKDHCKMCSNLNPSEIIGLLGSAIQEIANHVEFIVPIEFE